MVKVLCYISEGRWFDPSWCQSVVKVLCYISEGRWFDPNWCQWIFHWYEKKNLPIVLWPWGRFSLQQKLVPGVFPGIKDGRCVRLTTLPPSCAVVTKSGNFNFLRTLWACNGGCFTFMCIMFLLKMMMMKMIHYYLHLKKAWHIAGGTLTLVPFSNIFQARFLQSHVWYQYQNISVLNLDKWRTSCCVSKVFGCQSYKKTSLLVHLVRRLFPKTTFINMTFKWPCIVINSYNKTN